MMKYAIERIDDGALLTDSSMQTVLFDTIEEAKDEIHHQTMVVDEYEEDELRVVYKWEQSLRLLHKGSNR
ncbi:MAG: hypothetical protein F4X82_02200 [Candidatus Spechtbacteria bacterium SB0662_bin_43]|uniref:Uncharacterized protein n=1 Tax=Candidatus Spechtbacteria bacterium SB0662_bin_43 TaxID=2604897 RepID=A0A845DB85_9BACT|nr:hypothetical protein [Candidatus Spechtbacteria bacterium SB0662_bin_43]